MAKSRSGYKRSRHHQPPPGVRIPVRTEEASALLAACAADAGCTIGQWAERNLLYALSGVPYIGVPGRPATAMLLEPFRYFEIAESTWGQVVQRVGKENGLQWIARTLLFVAMVEMERLRGLGTPPERFG